MNRYIELLKDDITKEEIIAMYNIFNTGLDFADNNIKYVLCLEDDQGTGNAYVIPYIKEKPKAVDGIILTTISKENDIDIETVIEDKIKELSE